MLLIRIKVKLKILKIITGLPVRRNMKTVINVKFDKGNKSYFFDPNGMDFDNGDYVIVETARGVEFGEVVKGNHDIEGFNQEIKPIQRRATEQDIARNVENIEKGKNALKTAQEKARYHKLDMKLISAEYTFDRSKVVITFTADGRIDFRELVKDLASILRTRIELRQIYDRDDIKSRGALSYCGRECCCKAFLNDFEKVSIKMAKNQSLSLNPQKISGVCGKLMCCLKYENDYYQEVNKKMPKRGAIIDTPDGKGEVEYTDVLLQTVTAKLRTEDDTFTLKTFALDDILSMTNSPIIVKEDNIENDDADNE